MHNFGTTWCVYVEAGWPHPEQTVELYQKLILCNLNLLVVSSNCLWSCLTIVLNFSLLLHLFEKNLLGCSFICLFLLTILYLALSVFLIAKRKIFVQGSNDWGTRQVTYLGLNHCIQGRPSYKYMIGSAGGVRIGGYVQIQENLTKGRASFHSHMELQNNAIS